MAPHYEEITRELRAKKDEVATMTAQAMGKDEVIRNAEARLRLEENALRLESQQHEVATRMAREVASGQYSVLKQF
ncbi:MAG: hypothetical protein ACKPKO_35120, partial [Candidatus Fonsibacter sp.]